MGVIRVELEVLESVQRRMQEQNDHYHLLYGQLFSQVDEMESFWSGKDQKAFVNQIHGFEDDFNKMYQLVNEYCGFLRKSIQAYRACQDETEQAAYRLVQ